MRTHNIQTSMLKNVCMAVFILYISIYIFWVYAAENFLSVLSYSSVIFLAVVASLLFKKRLSGSNLFFVGMVALWGIWFSLCLRGDPTFLSYRNMILAIAATVVFCYFVFDVYVPNMLIIYAMLTFCIITITITLGYLTTNEFIVREIASGNTEYKGLGIGGYDFSYCLMLIVPCCLFHIRHGRKLEKLVIAAILLIIELYFLRCGLFTTFILSILGVAIWILLNTHNRILKMLIGVLIVISVFVLLFLGTSYIADFIRSIDSGSTVIDSKLSDIAQFITGENDSHGTISGRTSRYELSFKGFCASPIFGWAFSSDTSLYSGGHSTYLDYLASTGILGVSFYVIFMTLLYRKLSLRIKTADGLVCYKVAFVMFLIASFLKGTSYASIIFTICGVTPLYIVALESRKIKGRMMYESSSN